MTTRIPWLMRSVFTVKNGDVVDITGARIEATMWRSWHDAGLRPSTSCHELVSTDMVTGTCRRCGHTRNLIGPVPAYGEGRECLRPTLYRRLRTMTHNLIRSPR